MTQLKFKRVTSRYAKSQFTTIGLALIFYVLVVLYMPYMIYMINENASVFSLVPMSDTLVVGLVYVTVLVGTLIPFTFVSKAFKIKIKDYWRGTHFSFVDFIVYSIVFLALGTALVFATSIINMYIPLGTNAYIGTLTVLPTDGLSSILYALLYCFALPIIEEISFRGVLLRALGAYGNRFATFACAIIYALMQADMASMIPAFFMALFLINLTLRHKSITPAIAVHIVFNLFMYGFEFIPSDFLMIATGLIFVIYLLALYFVLTRRYIYIKIKKVDHKYITKLFYARPTIIIAILMSIIYMVISRLG